MNCLYFLNQIFILSRYRECTYYRGEFVRIILILIPSFFNLLHNLYTIKPSTIKRKEVILSIVNYIIIISSSIRLEILPSIVTFSTPIMTNLNPFSTPLSFPVSPYKSFLFDIIKSFWMSKEDGIKEYCYNIIKEITHLLEDYPVNSFYVQVFYSDYIHYLSIPILQNQFYDICPLKEVSLLFYIKLLSLFVINSSTLISYYLPFNNLLSKIISIQRKGTEISVAILLLIKNIFVSRETISLDNLIKDNIIIKYVIQLYVDNSKECNLICSSVLDLFNYINSNNLTDIINTLMDFYEDELQSIPSIYQEFHSKYICGETSKKRQRAGESPNQINMNSLKKISI